MLWAAVVPLEVRAGESGVTFRGRFPYGTETELGKGRFERFDSRSLEPVADVRLLFGHDYNRPLASTGSGSLMLRNGSEALEFEARIAGEVAETSHGRDALALARSGLAVGLSPAFIVEAGGERVTRRSDGGLLRSISRAALHELSIVTCPAYEAATVEARSWSLARESGDDRAGIVPWWML